MPLCCADDARQIQNGAERRKIDSKTKGQKVVKSLV